MIANEKSYANKIIDLAYRQNGNSRNHYDSICNIPQDDIYKTAKIVSTIQKQKEIMRISLT